MQQSCQPDPFLAPRGGVSAGWLYIGNSTHIKKKNFNKHTPTPLLLKKPSKKFKKNYGTMPT